MTIYNPSSSGNEEGRDCDNEDTIVSNEQYLSSSNARLNNNKWDYDIDTENFVRHLPKVSAAK